MNRARQKNGTIYVTERAYYIDPRINSPLAIASVKIGRIPPGQTDIIYDDKVQKKCEPRPQSTSNRLRDVAREMLSDERQKKSVAFDLGSFWIVCLLASLTGKNCAVHIADYWEREAEKLRKLLPGLPRKPISHDTIRRLMTLLRPEEGCSSHSGSLTSAISPVTP